MPGEIPPQVLAMLRPGGGAPGAGAPAPGGAPHGGPANTGPVTTPQSNAGSAATATQALGVALKALQQALPAIPIGSELHEKVLRITADLSKQMQSVKEDPQLQIQQLMQMIRAASQQAPNAMLQKMAPMAPGAPPAMAPPVPGGGAPPPPMSEAA